MFKQGIRNWWSWTKGFLGNNRGNVQKMFTPPKSKSPWEAMTSGSTGGWAGFAGPSTPTNPDDPAGWGWVGPAATTALGAVPYVGPLLSSGMGAIGAIGGGTGYQGSDYGNANWGSTISGALAGYGLGALGSGISGGIQGAAGGMPTGAASSVATGPSGAWGTGVGGTAAAGFGTGISNYGVNSMIGSAIAGANTTGGGPTGTSMGTTSALGVGTKSALDSLLNPSTLMGLTTTGLSQAKIEPDTPQIGPIASKWLTTDAVTKAGALAKDIAEIEYMGDFAIDKETQAFMQVSEKEINRAYKIRRESLDSMGQAANSQWRTSGERLEMHRRLNEEEQREVDVMKSQWILAAKMDYNKNKYNYVMEQIKVDDATKRELLYADWADVYQKYGIERDVLLDLRSVARDAGIYLTSVGMGVI